MAKGKLILICHSGGDFVTNDDGTLSYNGGEANAINITTETPLNDIKLELAEECNLDQKTVTIKYFLPGNKKNLIIVRNDKDVKRMISFHGDAITAEVFVFGTPGFERPNVEIQSTDKDETLNHDDVVNKKTEPAKRSRPQAKIDDKGPTSPQVKRTRSAIAAVKTAVVPDDNDDDDVDDDDDDVDDDDDDMADGFVNETSLSSPSDCDYKKADSDSDYRPDMSEVERKRNSQSEIDIDVVVNKICESVGPVRPANSDKKRRQTPVWKFGPNGRPTIVSSFVKDSAGPKKSGNTKLWKFSANGRPTIVTSPDNDSAGPKSGEKTEFSEGRKLQRKSLRLVDEEDSLLEMSWGGNSGGGPLVDDSDQEVCMINGKEPAVYDENAHAVPEDTVEVWKSAITGVGQQFANVNEFRASMKKYAIANRFKYKYKKNDTIRAIGLCVAEGCTWKIKAVWVRDNKSFMITKFYNVHTCDVESRISAHSDKNWLVGTIKDRLRESPYIKPKEIANELLQDFGVKLSYTRIWRGIGDAREQLHGPYKESYNKLPWFCEKLVETNPGSIANLVIGEDKRFKSLFVSFHTLLIGFQNSCRPIIFLESVSLKSRYGEILLTANAIDGNDSFFVVAFAIVNVEDDDSWRWFLEQLRGSISNLQPITFVVDKDKNLKDSVLAVFENAHVGYSIYHLIVSFKRNMRGPFIGEGRGFLPVHLLSAAHAVRIVGFKKSMEQIKLISSHAYNWVMQSEPERWATYSFKGERFNFVTKDVGESYAKLIEEYKHSTILQKIDALIGSIIDDVEDAKMNASKWSGKLTFSKEKELEDERVKAHGLKVLISSDNIFEVRDVLSHVVNVSDRSCTCMLWKERGLPCRHALAVFLVTGKNPYEFCSGYFSADAYRSTYAESIHPVPIDGPPLQNPKKNEGSNVIVEKDECGNVVVEKDEGGDVDVEKDEGGDVDFEKEDRQLDVVKEVDDMGNVREENEDPNVLMLPPIPTKSFALMLKKEKEAEFAETDGEPKSTVTCSKCKQPGHNKKSCKIVL
ncbi:uncharacterized protein [Rutidosis leptorrhynchoides]|uniref:uncharacterized protein n=1 Tax=Rutidosis leptorrhynchoides TaxID=125765 RepID=UPI003A993E7D